ncbi:hypothetical protein [Streptomyces sp. KR55]|uniref:hypothetical protein n=1 Tax=Streptomyces sp. KR55 TaxID=3457425 RepID=UPI003FD128FF
MSRRSQRKTVSDPAADIPRPLTYAQRAYAAGIGYSEINEALWAQASRAELLYRLGFDWRTYGEDWPMPRSRYNQATHRREIVDDKGNVLTPAEWLAHVIKAAH